MNETGFLPSWIRFPNSGELVSSLLFVAVSAAAGLGQNPPPAVRIDLDQAIQLAITHNHALKAARTLIDQSKAEEITAAIGPNPVFTYDDVFVPISPSQWNSATFNNVTEFDIGAATLSSADIRVNRESRRPKTKPRSRARKSLTTSAPSPSM